MLIYRGGVHGFWQSAEGCARSVKPRCLGPVVRRASCHPEPGPGGVVLFTGGFGSSLHVDRGPVGVWRVRSEGWSVGPDLIPVSAGPRAGILVRGVSYREGCEDGDDH